MTLVMGIVNVTPDSFSDGGRYDSTETAVAHGRALVAQGAAIVDVGGESTRPGADRVPVEVELDRVLPVVTALAADGIRVSVDTMRAVTAAAAIDAGASVVNDVSGGRADADLLAVVADSGVDFVSMHWRVHSRIMQEAAHYDDVLAEVTAELAASREAALAAGVAGERIILDPGIGFSKNAEHNWALLAGLDRIQSLGHRVLVGVSRKRFLGEALGGRSPLERDAATAAVTTWCALSDVWGVRTHEVPAQLDAIAVAEYLRGAAGGASGWSGPVG